MSYNKVTLIGFVGKEAEVKTFESGTKVANFPLATTERGYKLANGTEVPERTDWHNIVCVNNNAAFAEKWIKKGSGVLVEGKLRNRQYETKQGEKRFITEILAERVEFFQFGKKQESNQQQSQQQQIQYEQTDHIGKEDDLPF
jgi:single-strand DNA-binding protein